MAAEFHYHDGGAARKAKEVHYHDGGAARKAKEIWYHDGGAARKAFTGFTLTGSNFSSVMSSTTLEPRIFWGPTGFCTERQNPEANTVDPWGTPETTNIGASYWVRFTLGAGDGNYDGSAAGVWHRLDSDPFNGIDAAGVNEERTRTLTYQISTDAAGSVIVATGSCFLSSDRT